MSTGATPASELSLHQRLRQASKQAHHQLDHHPMLAPLLRADLTRLQYASALACLHGIQASSEARIKTFVLRHPDLPEYRLRCRLPALEADLAELGHQPVPATSTWPELHSMGALVGMLYVVEGANLGGQVIAKTLVQHGHGHLPMQFFSGQGDSTAGAWQAFWEFANAHCPIAEYELAVSTALAVFDAIQAHFAGTVHLRTLGGGSRRSHSSLTAA